MLINIFRFILSYNNVFSRKNTVLNIWEGPFRVFFLTRVNDQVGCPRQRFLAIKSGKASDFLQAYNHTYYTQHIKNLELIGVDSGIKFLHGRVL